MKTQELVDFLLSLKGAQESYPFGVETQVFKVMDKVYALIGHRLGKDFVNLKAKPEDVLFLTEQYKAITPGYHMNKLHWISVDINDPEIQGIITDLVNHSYHLIVAKLTKKNQAILQNMF